MSWYSTREEAEKACKEKEKKFGGMFFPIKDKEQDCWWAQRMRKIEC